MTVVELDTFRLLIQMDLVSEGDEDPELCMVAAIEQRLSDDWGAIYHEEYVLDGSTTDERLEEILTALIKKTLPHVAAATKKERHHGA